MTEPTTAAGRLWRRMVANPFPFAVAFMALCVAAIVVATYA